MAYTTIDDPTLYFSTTLWSGNGTDDRDIVVDGTGMQPDWVWIKERSNAGYHFTFDSVRGATKNLHTNVTQAESTQANALQAFNSNGFEIGTDGDINNSGDTYVSWNWLAGGSASSNTDGDITSSVSANTTAGFSIVSYTGNGTAGATVGHGLGSALDMYIIKRRSATEHWQVYHSGNTSAPETDYLQLSTTEATVDATTRWNDTAPTSSVFSVGNHASVNGSSDTYIAYCFAEKKGYSKFGSYTGNGNADGPFIYTGFRPAWIMTKISSGADDWQVCDNKRDPDNAVFSQLMPNSSDAQNDGDAKVDFLSNGFKIRKSGGSWNGSGSTFIYMAFAEAPFVTSTGIPTTAR